MHLTASLGIDSPLRPFDAPCGRRAMLLERDWFTITVQSKNGLLLSRPFLPIPYDSLPL
jgi:hypothetical protein